MNATPRVIDNDRDEITVTLDGAENAATMCSVSGCGKRRYAFSWCRPHYRRWKKYGDPMGGASSPGMPVHYLREVVLAYDGDECLVWPYARNERGYGRIRVDGVSCVTSRVVCEETNGPPPTPDHQAAHSCGNGHLGCVTKRHLSWKTRLENKADELIHGTRARGDQNGKSKLTALQAAEIRGLAGTLSQKEIASLYGVAVQTIGHVINDRTWAGGSVR